MKKSKPNILIIIIIFFFFCGCFDVSNSNTKTENLDEYIQLVDEEVLVNPIASDETRVYYKGTIKNTGDQTIQQVEIKVNFYDEDNILLFSKSDNVSNLKQDQTEDFQVIVQSTEQYYNQIDHVDYTFQTN